MFSTSAGTASPSSGSSSGGNPQATPSGAPSGSPNPGAGGGGGQTGGHFAGGGRDGGTAGADQSGQQPGAGAFDWKSAFDNQGQELRRARDEFGQFREKASEDLGLVQKLRDVFNPKAAEAESPVKQWEAMLDYYIAQGVEAEKRGQPMPLTINNGITMYKTMIEQHNREQALTRQLSDMKGQLDRLNDPGHMINTKAYGTMDETIKRGLDSLYGQGGQNIETKRAIFNAIGQSLAPVVNQLMQRDPGRWDMIRRDPEALQELANRALRAHVPPRALEMIAQEQARNTPMPVSELRQALRELRARTDIDPQQRQELDSQLRQEIWETMYRGGKIKAG